MGQRSSRSHPPSANKLPDCGIQPDQDCSSDIVNVEGQHAVRHQRGCSTMERRLSKVPVTSRTSASLR
eukprot:Gb_34046 [translate_table: standard]